MELSIHNQQCNRDLEMQQNEAYTSVQNRDLEMQQNEAYTSIRMRLQMQQNDIHSTCTEQRVGNAAE